MRSLKYTLLAQMHSAVCTLVVVLCIYRNFELTVFLEFFHEWVNLIDC